MLPGRSPLYILDGHTPVQESDPIAWALWMQQPDRELRLSEVSSLTARLAVVSTVFLGVSSSSDPGMMFETMIFWPGDQDRYQKRYDTWDEAIKGHEEAIQKVLDENRPT